MSVYEIPADKQDHLYLHCSPTLGGEAHFHQSVELIVVLEGGAEAFVNGTKYELQAGEAIFADAFDVHYYKTKPHSLYVAIVVSRSYLRDFYNYLGERTVLRHFPLPAEAQTHAKAWATSEKPSNRLELIAELYHLLSYLPLSQKSADSKKRPLITEIFTYLHQSYDKPLTIGDVAAKFGYSRGYLSTLFSAYTGDSMNAYLNHLRVKAVRRAQQEDPKANILELALNAGFESASTFYRAYKKMYGEPPCRKNMTK